MTIPVVVRIKVSCRPPKIRADLLKVRGSPEEITFGLLLFKVGRSTCRPPESAEHMRNTPKCSELQLRGFYERDLQLLIAGFPSTQTAELNEFGHLQVQASILPDCLRI
jgi:hypothetical protein